MQDSGIFPRQAPPYWAGVLGSAPSSQSWATLELVFRERRKNGDSAPEGLGVHGLRLPRAECVLSLDWIAVYYYLFLPGWLDQLAWTLSPCLRALAGNEGSREGYGVLGAGASLSCPHLHTPGLRHSRDEEGREGEGRDRGQDGGPPPGGCLDNIRNRGRGFFRRGASASCISHSRWGRGGGRGWMWQRQAQLVRL